MSAGTPWPWGPISSSASRSKPRSWRRSSLASCDQEARPPRAAPAPGVGSVIALTGLAVGVVACRNEGSDRGNGPEVIDLQVIHFGPYTKMVLELQQQLHHSDRVESPRRQQIGVGCGHVDVQVAGEDRRDLGLDRRERGGGRHRATTASGANSSLRRRRSIFPFVVLGSSGKVSQRDGSMYGGRARANASRSAAGDMSASAPGAYAQQMATPSKSWLGTPTTAHSRSVPSACNAASISPSSTR